MRDIRLHDPALSTTISRSPSISTPSATRLVSNSQDVRQDFEFFLIKDPTLNAFALPGRLYRRAYRA